MSEEREGCEVKPELKIFEWECPNDSTKYYQVYVNCKDCSKTNVLYILKGHWRSGYVKCSVCENMINL